MNKKDIINSFESLTPSDSQKKRMLENILNSGMKKEVHKNTFKFRYAFTTAAAAVCVAAVIVIAEPLYNKPELGQTPQTETGSRQILDNDMTITAGDIDEDYDNSEYDNNAAESPNASDSVSAPPKKADQTNENKTSSESTALPDSSTFSANENSVESDSTVQSRDAVSEEAATGSSSLESVSASAFNDSAEKDLSPKLYINSPSLQTDAAGGQVSLADGIAEEITLEEYYDYLGVNVEEKIRIPEGFSPKISSKALINTQTDDCWFFEYQKGDSYIRIKTTKHTESISSYFEDEHLTASDINGIPAVVMRTGNNFSAYIIFENVGYSINTENVSRADLTDLLISITE